MDVDLIRTKYELDALEGRATRTLTDTIDLLQVSLAALNRNRVEVASERVEVAIDLLQALLNTVQH